MPIRRNTQSNNTYRFFVDPRAITGGVVRIDDPALMHQIAGVLRLAPGDRVALLDGTGAQYIVALERVERRGSVTGIVEQVEQAGGEPHAQLTMFLPLIRAERFEWALQKGTELGVAAFVPTVCARSLSDGGPAAKKLERWRAIVREAAEQSRRGRLPPVEPPIPFADACLRAAGTTALLLWEGSGARGLRAVLRGSHPPLPVWERGRGGEGFSILSGPEGGLSDDERRTAAEHGIIEVSLGARTLRAETAPLVAAAGLLYELGELE
jgi:16S rRNA (uracil1498-N3)-methyltransferase